MTGPDSGAAAAAQYTVQAVQENAERLGLIWKRKRATVITADPTATLDGDSEPIAMTSLIGNVRAGQRVYVDVVPPSANFIVGVIPLLPRLRLRNASFTLNGGVDQTISWTTQDEKTGDPWYAGALPASTLMVPEDGWYSVVASLNTDTPGVANSRQIVSIEPSIASGGLSGYAYRSFWGIGEVLGSTSTYIPLVASNTITIHGRQNSAATMVANAVVIIAKVADL